MNIKKNIPLILGLSIPILMIVFVTASIYIPGIFIKPKYDFVYLLGDNYYRQEYSVKNNRLIYSPTNQPTYYPSLRETKIFFYDTSQNTSRQISYEEVQTLILDSNTVSADGFQIIYGSRGNSIFPFFFYSDRDYDSRYIQGHNISKKLNINLTNDYYDQFQFIGWVIR